MVDTEDVLNPDLQQREAADPEKCVWVAASAGSGKTKVLTDRVLTLLLGGALPNRILCLTFTKAAAAEMANRVTERLAAWTVADPETLDGLLSTLLGRMPDPGEIIRARRLFAEVLDVPGGLRIQTIHSFCESLIARFPFESGIPPHFEVMDERTAAELMIRSRDRVLAAANSDDKLADSLSVLSCFVQEDQFANLISVLQRDRGKLQRVLDDSGGIDRTADSIRQALGVSEKETVETVRAEAVDAVAFDSTALRQAAKALLQGTVKTDQPRGQFLMDWLAADPLTRASRFVAYCDLYFTRGGKRRTRLITAGAAKENPNAEEILAREAERLDNVQEHLKSVLTAQSSISLLHLGAALLSDYESIKRHRVCLDYDDLTYRAQWLLRRPGIAPWVLFKLDGGLDHILIDEAQDTNPEQWDIVAALAEEFFSGDSARPEMRTIFAVGDVKQSIFSFQRAAPALFNQYRKGFSVQARAVQRDWRDLDLSVSFRSTDAVLNTVDMIFSTQPANNGVVENAECLKHQAFRKGAAGLVEVWPPIGPALTEQQESWVPPIERAVEDNPSGRLAALIAAKIKAWIDVEMLPDRSRSMRAGDIMILLRRRSGFMEQIVAALKACNVPVAGVDRMMLADQLAVMDLHALGRFLLLPEDDLTLATILKSPFIGFDEEQLFQLAHGRGDDSIWSRLKQFAKTQSQFASVRDWLKNLLAKADCDRPYELFASLLAEPVPTGASGRESMLARLGPEADDPIDEFLNLAMTYESVHVPSLEGFLHWMAAGKVEIKRDLEQGSADEVRVMTVHGAKGLQAPVVILPDTMAKPVSSPEVLWHDSLPFWAPRRQFEPRLCRNLREEAEAGRDQEYRRLLYVALTRAEDWLYVCGYHGSRPPSEDCWYTLIRDGLSTTAESVSFDFGALISGGWKGEGLRYETSQRRKVEKHIADSRRTINCGTLPDWMYALAPQETTPPKPLTPSRPVQDPPAASPLGDDDGRRFKRGLIIHRLLQILPDLPSNERRLVTKRLLGGESLGLGSAEQENILETVLTVIDGPEFSDLFGSNSKAEVPLIGTVEMAHGPEIVAGQVDRLIVRDDEVLVVDYKSMRPPPKSKGGVPEVYLRQMAAYRAVLRGIWPNRQVKCAMLWTENPSIMVLDDVQLDSYSVAP